MAYTVHSVYGWFMPQAAVIYCHSVEYYENKMIWLERTVQELIQIQPDLLSIIKYLLEQLWSIKSNAIHNNRRGCEQ